MRLAAGLCPDPLEELTALSKPPSWILGIGAGKGEEGREEGREGRRGKDREERKGKEMGKDGPPPNKKSWVRA